MLKIFLSTLLVLWGLPTMAYPDLVCSAVDRGSEEHWGGHGSCDQCLREHGHCVETCSVRFTTCEATGRDYRGQSITLRGHGDDRYDAERAALSYCQRNFSDCRIASCSNSGEQVSRRECERPAPPPAPKPPAPTPAPPHPKPPPKPPAPAPKPPAPAPKPPAPAPKPPTPPAPKPPGKPDPKPGNPGEGPGRPGGGGGGRPGGPGRPGGGGGGKPGGPRPPVEGSIGMIEMGGLKHG